MDATVLVSRPQNRGKGTILSQGPFIGRSADIQAIDDHLARGERLVTITGPGGVGKTRLATEVMGRYLAGLEKEENSGVWLCDLSEATDLSGVCDLLADALGVPSDQGSIEMVERLGQAMASREALVVVFDNFDPVTKFANESIGRWLQLAPNAQFLVTSRERMHLAGEIVHELSPLELPRPNDDPTVAESVELFIKTAQRARRGWESSDEELPFVVEIVSELDGLPLAIELAASRMAIMGPRALLYRLRSGFDVLKRTQKGGANRHQTLESTIDWSFKLLPKWEQDALVQCSIFVGGFSADAAESVVHVEEHKQAPPILDIIQSLRNKSLLRAFEPPGLSGEIRLGLYSSIRNYALAKLEQTGDRDELERRHAQYFVDAGTSWAADIYSNDGDIVRRRILLERENFLAVAERILDRGHVTVETAQPALQSLLVLAPVLMVHGPLQTFARLIDPVLDATMGSGADPSLLGQALAARGVLKIHQGKNQEGFKDLIQALTLAKKLGDEKLEARVTLNIAQSLLDGGEFDEAEGSASDCLDLYRKIGDGEGIARSLGLLGQIQFKGGQYDKAREFYQSSLEQLTQTPSSHAESALRRLFGELNLAEGRLERAESYLESSRTLCRELEDFCGEAMAAGFLAMLRHDAGLFERASQEYSYVIEGVAESGFRMLEGVYSGYSGLLCFERNQLNEAERLLNKSRMLLADGGDLEHLCFFQAIRGGVDAESGQIEKARVAIENAAEQLRESRPSGHFLAAIEALRTSLDRSLVPQLIRGAKEETTSLQLRLIRRSLKSSLNRNVESKATEEIGPEALLVDRSGLWFRPPNGEKVSLERRKPLRLLLEKLMWQRLEHPGEPIPWDGLLDVGWPGERVIPSAGAHRVRVAVSTLRKLGLKSVLLTVEEGYLLSAKVSAHFSQEENDG